VKVKNDRNEEGLVPVEALRNPNKATATKWKATKEHKGPDIQGFISLELGDAVVEIEPPKDGWVKVKNDRDEEGLVPLNSLSKIEGIPYKATATKWEATKEHKGPGIQGFISLKLGDIVVEIESPKDGWVKVKMIEMKRDWFLSTHLLRLKRFLTKLQQQNGKLPKSIKVLVFKALSV